MGSVMLLNAPQSRDIVFNGSSLMTWTYSVTQNVDNTRVLVDADKMEHGLSRGNRNAANVTYMPWANDECLC